MGSGTMRQEQAAETRKKLLDSAQKMFSANGYEGTSIRMINRNAGLADGLLYHYFPGGKKEIFQAVVVRNVQQILEALKPKMDIEKNVELPLETILNSFYEHFIHVVDEHSDMIRILLREDEAKEFLTHEQMEELVGSRKLWLAEILQRKYEKNEVRKMDFEAAEVSFNSILMNQLLLKVCQIDPCPMEDSDKRKRLIDYHVKSWLM